MNANRILLAIVCSAMLACENSGHSQPLTIYTMAGHDAPGSANGYGSNARFNHPIGAASDTAGNLYVADTGNGTVRKIAPNGLVTTLAGNAGIFGSANGTGTNALFHGLQGIAVDNDGFLYVADTANALIRKISPAGSVTAFAGDTGAFNSFDGAGTNANFFQPEGVAVDGAGNVYVADAWNHTIRKISVTGTASTLAGLAGYYGAADGTNSKARFHRPAGIALDGATNVFVADFMNHTIRKITPAGSVSTIGGLPGVWGSADGTNRSARFFHPQGIAVDSAGNLLVADSGNQVVRKISLLGTNWVVSTVAGQPGNAGVADGTGSTAQFYFPAGIALDGAGELYLADSANNNIRTTFIVSPTLQYTAAGNQLLVSWPLSSSGFTLETSPVLGAGAVWSPLTNDIVILSDNFFKTNGLNNAAAFFRLRRP